MTDGRNNDESKQLKAALAQLSRNRLRNDSLGCKSRHKIIHYKPLHQSRLSRSHVL